MDNSKIDSQIKEIDEILPEPGHLMSGDEKIELPKFTLRLQLEVTRKLLRIFKLIDYNIKMNFRNILGHAMEGDQSYEVLKEAVALASGMKIEAFLDKFELTDFFKVLLPFFGIALSFTKKPSKKQIQEALESLLVDVQSGSTTQEIKSSTTKKKR